MNPFLAQIVLFAGNFAPRGWAFCDGQILPISSNSALFSLLGTTYGGDGRTSFALPDLRGRAAVHPGRGPGLSTIKLGQRGGQETIQLNLTHLPSHVHNAAGLEGTVNASSIAGDSEEPEGNSFGVSQTDTPYTDEAANTPMVTNTVSINGNTAIAGGGQPFNSRNPFLGINYIIAMQGTYPSRN
jgi:microcystin-dependent protein